MKNNPKKYDKASKMLIEAFQEHIIYYLTNSHPDKIESLDREINLHNQSVDSIFKINDEYILNIEFQTKYEENIEFRVLLYNILLELKYALPVRTIIVYLTKKDESKMKSYYKKNCYGTNIDFSFEMIKAWELDIDKILNEHMYGMYPFLVLSRKDKELAKMLYDRIMEADIEGVKKSNLVNALSVFLNLIYKKEDISDMLAYEKLEELEIIKEAKEESYSKGKLEGKLEGKIEEKLDRSRDYVLRLLNKKFKQLPNDLELKIKETINLDVLDQITDSIFDINSIDEVYEIVK